MILLLQAILVFALVTVALLMAGAFTIAWFSIHPLRFRNRRNPSQFGATYENIGFSSADGTPLKGWYIPAEGARSVLILAHGMSANRSQMIPWAEWLWKAGYSILLFDFRGLGESGGDVCTMGLREPEDILAAVDYLESKEETSGSQVGILGFSMGGTSAMIAAARDERIEFVVSHGAYADLDRAIYQRCRKHFGPLAPPVDYWSRKFGQRWFPVESSEISALREVGKIAPRPLLLLNGAKDSIVRPRNAHDLLAAAGRGDLWILPNSGHAYPGGVDETEYRQLVLNFIKLHAGM